MKIINPNFVPPNQAKINTLERKLLAHLDTRKPEREITFQSIRDSIGPQNLTDGEISQAAQNLRLEVGD